MRVRPHGRLLGYTKEAFKTKFLKDPEDDGMALVSAKTSYTLGDGSKIEVYKVFEGPEGSHAPEQHVHVSAFVGDELFERKFHTHGCVCCIMLAFVHVLAK